MALTDSNFVPGTDGGGVNPATAQELLTAITIAFSVPDYLMAQITPIEVTLAESLLTPGLQTTIKVHSYLDNLPIKNLDLYKGSTVTIDMLRQINGAYGALTNLRVQQTVYRIGCFKTLDRRGMRKLVNDRIEEFTIHACDPTILNDAQTLVTKLWKCTPPSPIVAEMLACVGARATDVEPSCCPRDYKAENIKPFQVIDQQADVALNGGSPSFLHYMTYENLGTHKFRSLDSLVTQGPMGTFYFGDTGVAGPGYQDPWLIMTYGAPCDFDLLADVMNGIGVAGVDLTSVAGLNPFNRFFNFGGIQALTGCTRGTTLTQVLTNLGSEGLQFSCPDYSMIVAQKRRARMMLVEQDKITLKMTVPWNPGLNAGKVLNLELRNKVDPGVLNFGSGLYLIHSVTHKLLYGGFSTTTVECVSTTVGGGTV